MAKYTVQDEKTGRKITFDWYGDKEPTENDIEEVFSSVDYTQMKQQMTDVAQTGQRVKNMLGNYPRSLGNLLKGAAQGTYQAVRHPINTLDQLMVGAGKNIIAPGLGAVQKMTGLGESAIPQYEDAKQRFLASRYGSLENFADYMEKDPAQAQADIALALTGTGKLLGASGKAASLPALERVGKATTAAGAMAEPITAPLKVTGTALQFMTPSRMAQKMYASSAKMSTIMDPEVRQRISQSLLDAEVKLNTKGFKKLADDFESLWRGVDDMVDKYVSTGKNDFRTVKDLLKDFDSFEERAKLTGRSGVVRSVRRQFEKDLIDNVKIGNSTVQVYKELNAKELNRLKRDIYQELYSQYGREMVPLKSALKMNIAHNAMEALETMIPGIIPKNKTAAAYKELMDAIQNGVNRIENRDLFSIGMPVRAGGTAVISEALGLDTKVGGIAGLALGMLDLPSVKSRVAIRLNKLKKQGVRISPTSTAVKIGLVKLGEGEE